MPPGRPVPPAGREAESGFRMSITCEVIAVGTELLLGQSIDTNSSRIGERLARFGIDSHFQTKVGDNRDRIAAVLRIALERSDAVVMCGGLGPTHDDLTREAIAMVMDVPLIHDEAIAERIHTVFAARGRSMPENNLRQALVPEGAEVIEQRRGTAPGLICPVGPRMVYALPGVPYELEEMLERTVLPDLIRRAGQTSVIESRELRTWGESESGLAERLAPVIERLDEAPGVTLAFLASGMEGLRVRLTTRAPDVATARLKLDVEEAAIRSELGTLVFGVDRQSMEQVVLEMCRERGLTLAVAEEVTGGIVARRLSAAPGGRGVFVGGLVVGDDSHPERWLWMNPDTGRPGPGPEAGPGADPGLAMAAGVARLLGADVGLAVTRTREVAVHRKGASAGTTLQLPADPEQARQIGCISALNFLRLHLLAEGSN